MPDQPNVILICVDQWRGDCLSIDGHPVVQTPYLDQMAAGGCRFSRAYSATPSCIPARAALFTGLKQTSHGRVGYKDGIRWDYPCTIASEFTRHGYQTQSIGKMHVHPPRSQMGFQNVILHDGHMHYGRKRSHGDLADRDDYLFWLQDRLGRDADYFSNGLNCNSVVARPWQYEERYHPTNWVTSEAIDFLRRRDDTKPFFLYMSYHRPHPPYDPPQWAYENYRRREMPDVPVGDWADLFDHLESMSASGQRRKLDADMLHQARSGYYGHLTHIDHQLNRFMEIVGEWSVGETIVCFTSDHGELMGDHHLFRKSLPYEGSARVPLFFKGGGAEAGISPGMQSDAVAELRDIMPTLLDCAGLPIPESVEGKSLLPVMRGQSESVRGDLHGEHTGAFGSSHYMTDGREKYLWFSETGHEQLFDLENDPQELHDKSQDADAADRLGYWRSRLTEELAGREEGFVQDGKLIAGQPVTPALSCLPKREV